jgi:glycosyltransferase involved in cell wall biosynthesis
LSQDSLKIVTPHAVEISARHKRTQRVLYLTDLHPADKFGSLEEQILTLAKALDSSGGALIPVFGAPVGKETAAQYRELGLNPESLDLHRYSLSSLWRLLTLVRRHCVDVIHWNFYNPINPYVVALSMLVPRVRHYLTDHNSRIPNETVSGGSAKRRLKRILLKRYSRVLCISDFVQEQLDVQQVWPTLSRCVYFVNTARFRPDPPLRNRWRTQLGLADPGKFVILFVGKLIKWKGVDVAIRAMLQLPESAVLLVVGDGPVEPELRELTTSLKLEKRVRFLGNQRNVEPFMQAADCFICPSLWGEAVGLVNIEALASGLPVVASQTGGIPEFIDDKITGLLFMPGDEHGMADRLNFLIENPRILRSMSKKARTFAVEKYSIQKRVPDYLELYTSKV